MRRARGSPPPPPAPHRLGSPPSHPGSAPAPSTSGLRGGPRYPVSRAEMWLCRGTEGRHARPRHARSAASRGGPCGGFPGQRGHGAAAPCPRGGVGKPLLHGISPYRRWRRLKDGRGKLRAWGEAPGTGKLRVAPAVALAAACVGAPSPVARRAGRRSGARILPAGPGAGAAGPCPVRWRAEPPPCAPGAVPARGLRLCLPGGGARGRPPGRKRPVGLGGEGGKQKRFDAERGRRQRSLQLGWGQAGGEHRPRPAAPMPSGMLQRNDLEMQPGSRSACGGGGVGLSPGQLPARFTGSEGPVRRAASPACAGGGGRAGPGSGGERGALLISAAG